VGGQWTKLIINEVNAMPAITGLSVQQTVAEPGLRRVITAAMREAVRLALATGIRFGSLQGLNHGMLRAFAVAPLSIGQLLPRLMARRMGATPNLGSTLQSVRRGQRTEIDYLSGAVVSVAAAAAREAPVNAALVSLVHEVEESGGFVQPARVLGRTERAVRG
jgi:2-dehydropantoate 2-reductase